MNLFETQLQEGRMVAGLPPFKRKVEKAQADIRAMLDRAPASYVALSWGKQSSVLAHLIYAINSTIPGVFWRGAETDIIADFNAVRDAFLTAWPMPYQEEFCDYDFKQQAREWSREHQMQGVFIGMVSDESKKRRYALGKAETHNIFAYADGFLRSCPLKTWSNLDIASYVATHKLPMLSIYRRYGFDARTSARIKRDGTSYTERGYEYLTRSQQSRFDDLQGGHDAL
jgi:3'-phosphoadenosine 5'-phosphosulfate sulfotransferase (PAPS reductase)/FAD synthetase